MHNGFATFGFESPPLSGPKTVGIYRGPGRGFRECRGGTAPAPDLGDPRRTSTCAMSPSCGAPTTPVGACVAQPICWGRASRSRGWRDTQRHDCRNQQLVNVSLRSKTRSSSEGSHAFCCSGMISRRGCSGRKPATEPTPDTFATCAGRRRPSISRSSGQAHCWTEQACDASGSRLCAGGPMSSTPTAPGCVRRSVVLGGGDSGDSGSLGAASHHAMPGHRRKSRIFVPARGPPTSLLGLGQRRLSCTGPWALPFSRARASLREGAPRLGFPRSSRSSTVSEPDLEPKHPACKLRACGWHIRSPLDLLL